MKYLFITVTLILTSLSSFAATFCVSSSAELANALETAEDNGEDDHIRIQPGDYLTINNERFAFLNQEDHDLTISGGWTPFNQINCFFQLGTPLDTTIDGNDNSPVLYLQNNSVSSAKFTVSNMTIANGFSDNTAISGGLMFYTHNSQYSGEILIDRVLFLGNEGNNGAALYQVGRGKVVIRNSVFMFNTTQNGNGSAYFSMDAEAAGLHFINNTLVFNNSGSASTAVTNVSGLLLNLNWDNGDTPDALIANNLFWDQNTRDFYVTFSGGNTMLYNNNYENGSGFFADTANNLSLPPGLEPQLLNFTPAPGSPLNGKGLAMDDPLPLPTAFLESWDHGIEDFDGGFTTRVAFGRVDIGAVEAPWEGPIFADGFDD
ncbi:hypothetical protein ACFODZ_01085 [Marinicella sediminis]|uniref:Right-handed parallel beta-helix repeat-containing protein n=1 Tax=Marinicella sediminis TaxID=1792834 RepID=A0ABV7JBK4_9GAMM|nr:hypothetical protein [Marinicella sediminis]